MRIIALSCVLLLLAVGSVSAGHIHDEDTEIEHDCSLCETQSLSLFHDIRIAPSSSPAAVRSQLPGPQGPPLFSLYGGCLLSRAPPVPARSLVACL